MGCKQGHTYVSASPVFWNSIIPALGWLKVPCDEKTKCQDQKPAREECSLSLATSGKAWRGVVITVIKSKFQCLCEAGRTEPLVRISVL